MISAGSYKYKGPYCKKNNCDKCNSTLCNCKCHKEITEYFRKRKEKPSYQKPDPIEFFDKPITYKEPTYEKSTKPYTRPKVDTRNKDKESHRFAPMSKRGKAGIGCQTPYRKSHKRHKLAQPIVSPEWLVNWGGRVR